MHLIRPRIDVRPVRDERCDRTAGYQIHHWDGRVDAIVTPAPIRVQVRFVPVGAHPDDHAPGLIFPVGVAR